MRAENPGLDAKQRGPDARQRDAGFRGTGGLEGARVEARLKQADTSRAMHG